PTKAARFKSDPMLVHHEIRTPLNQIIGYGEILQEEAHERGATAFIADFEKIITAARELLRLVVENFSSPEMDLGPDESQPASQATVFIRRETATSPSLTRQEDKGTSPVPGASILVVDDD